MTLINLGNISIDIEEYAIQGNGILGIRDSGKSYTATFMAERLLDNGIPFVAFDPIGIWKYLRVAGKKAGYPIVVAGGKNGDLPLTPQSAPEIVRAAMRENIPLVLDLYDIELSKADWKRIVETSVRLLTYENGEHGLRHIFIEEAAEFCPQRVMADQGKVYAEIEKLARMGGNAQLGYTLINQRAEEVNKAVLELCDCLFLHRQKGRNSLTALGKWLDVGAVVDVQPIKDSLPTLDQGDCWVWLAGSDQPVRTHIPEKSTLHPDRRARTATEKEAQDFNALDVSGFVSKLNTSLEKYLEQAKKDDPAELRKEIAVLKRQLTKAAKSAETTEVVREVQVPVMPANDLERLIKELGNHLGASVEVLGKMGNEIERLNNTKAPKPVVQSRAPALKPPRITPIVSAPRDAIDLALGPRKILTALAQYDPEPLDKKRLGILTGYSYKSGTFSNYIGQCNSNGWLAKDGTGYLITVEGYDILGDYDPLPTGSALQAYWTNKLGKGPSLILQALIDAYPHKLTKEQIGELTDYSHTSGTFSNYLGKLRTLALIKGSQRMQASESLFD